MKYDLPVGSIVELSGLRLCVVGYASKEDEKNSDKGYFVVPFPLGFLSLKEIKYISIKDIDNVVFKGYSTQNSEDYISCANKVADLAEKADVETVKEVAKTLVSVAKKYQEGNL